jgi:hypothetical protein
MDIRNNLAGHKVYISLLKGNSGEGSNHHRQISNPLSPSITLSSLIFRLPSKGAKRQRVSEWTPLPSRTKTLTRDWGLTALLVLL